MQQPQIFRTLSAVELRPQKGPALWCRGARVHIWAKSLSKGSNAIKGRLSMIRIAKFDESLVGPSCRRDEGRDVRRPKIDGVDSGIFGFKNQPPTDVARKRKNFQMLVNQSCPKGRY